MKITLEFVGVVLSDALEKKRDVEVDESITVLGILQNLKKSYRSLPNILSGDPPRPTSNFIILVNGREISVLSGLETKLHEGDEVTIIPVSHGG
ncbi:MAG: MoaD/ThiS family protein [Candidatus Hermodarchaeia archaeon]|jgi:molybdopterin converting factor small subunit